MNVRGLQQLISAVEESDDFDMSNSSTCLVGHAFDLFRPDDMWQNMDEWLDVPEALAYQLYIPDMPGACYYAAEGEEGHITKERALACLSNLIDTGQVDWGHES